MMQPIKAQANVGEQFYAILQKEIVYCHVKNISHWCMTWQGEAESRKSMLNAFLVQPRRSRLNTFVVQPSINGIQAQCTLVWPLVHIPDVDLIDASLTYKTAANSNAHQCHCFYWKHNALIRSMVCMIIVLIICVCTNAVCLIHSSGNLVIVPGLHYSSCFCN